MAHTAPAAELDFRCDVCMKCFSRQEHLKRHSLVHTQDRPYVCHICSKQFLRRDALDRHGITHQRDRQTLLRKGARACSECAAAKHKCSGDRECDRCRQRSLTCRYPQARKPRQARRDRENPVVAQTTENMATEKYPQDSELLPWQSLAPRSFATLTAHESFEEMPSYGHLNQSDAPQPVFQSSSLQHDLPPSHSLNPVGHNRSIYDGIIHTIPSYENALTTMPDSWDTSMMSTVNWLSDAPLGLHYDDIVNSVMSQEYFSDTTLRVTAPQAPSGSVIESPELISDDTSVGVVEPMTSPDKRQCRAKTTGGPGSIESETNTSYSGGQSRRSGTYYLDSASARQPKGKRRRLSARRFSQAVSADKALFALEECSQLQLVPESHYDISLSSYGEEYSWKLNLAVAAIGSHYVEGSTSQNFCRSMHEFVRRALIVSEESESSLPEHDIGRAQTILLHSIGTSYCGDQRLREAGFKHERELVAFCENSWNMNATQSAFKRSHQYDNGSTEQPWLEWRDRELRLRTGYSIWLMDCIWVINFQHKPLLSLEHAKPMMPCNENAWESATAIDWYAIEEKNFETSSLLSTIQMLYVEKGLSPDLGEFGRVLLIHGLFRRSWEVEAYFGQALSGWEPTVERQSSSELRLESSVWLPGVPEYVKWRNSACDCLDILHWSANATIGNSSGVEHPTVMHLHFARVVLLTPFAQIMRLAHFAMDNSSSSRATTVKNDEKIIRTWAIRDQYKARLAMIHAGVLLWHIRRFSTNAFYEPYSVVLGVLTLWAFTNFSGKSKPPTEIQIRSTILQPKAQLRERGLDDRSDSPHESEDADIAACSIILLDRPTDDELVQAFVRRGDTMVAHITGVGNLYGEEGPERVLEQGRKLLLTLNGWGVALELDRLLQTLVEITRRSRITKAAA